MMVSTLALIVGIVVLRYVGSQYYKTDDKPTKSALMIAAFILSFTIPVRYLGHQFDYLRELVPAREVVWAFLASCLLWRFTLRLNDNEAPDLTVCYKAELKFI